MKILIVEDQSQLAEFLERGLSEQSYTTVRVGSCKAASDALCETKYDAIVLDLNLPDGDGLDLLYSWRKAGFTEPIVILSARDAVEDRIKGLNGGADDYLPKPFSLEELLARLRSLIRRQQAVKNTLLEHRELRMDLQTRSVHLGGALVELTSREYALLEVFMHNPGRVLTRTFICEKIWESHYDVDANLLDVYMSKLRAKLENSPQRLLFKTLRGVGYQLL